MKKRNKKRKPPKTKQQLLAKLRHDVVGLSYSWVDDKVVQFISDDADISEYTISPRTVTFNHDNPKLKNYARYIFTNAKQLLSNYIAFGWVITINIEFENKKGEKFGVETQGAGRYTFFEFSDWVTEQIREAMDRASQASKGDLGEVYFKRAKFHVYCESA